MCDIYVKDGCCKRNVMTIVIRTCALIYIDYVVVPTITLYTTIGV